MSDYQLYEVLVPITGAIRVHLRAQRKGEAIVKAYEIAKEMKKDSTETIIPNLASWELDYTNIVNVTEKGEADE